MIINYWYVVYISVPSGHPGVLRVAAYDREEAKRICPEKAIVAILEAKA